ncbi:hypothetical protein EVC45_38480 [Paraburkholderia sp. UYCP14C]|uniref:hypothetical protein n=1 Tax=Paraburkholderia sp. UYCP14C TaxID=2511130 RepID=UPI0010221112|nr:hypothetical protein [Paraburkholderia sp. UYCP14C]RZF24501.1 hypothetical protein EVC45_38480 [Paraburkholderia sp. UYCP14C]
MFLLAIIGGVIFGASVWQDHVDIRVPAQEIVEPLKRVEQSPAKSDQTQGSQPPTGQGAAQSPLAGYRIPFALQKYVSDDNAQVVRNHLDDLPVADRQAYLDELGAVVTSAEASKVDVIAAINSYMRTKSERYKEAAAKTAQKWETLKLVAAGTASGLLLVALFSLVLVLLAIERNTRPLRQPVPASSKQSVGEVAQA